MNDLTDQLNQQLSEFDNHPGEKSIIVITTIDDDARMTVDTNSPRDTIARLEEALKEIKATLN